MTKKKATKKVKKVKAKKTEAQPKLKNQKQATSFGAILNQVNEARKARAKRILDRQKADEENES